MHVARVVAEDERVTAEQHIAPFVFAQRAQQLARVWSEGDPVCRLSRVWDVLYVVPRCGREDRAAVAEILRRIFIAFRTSSADAELSVLSRLHRSRAGDLHVARALAYLARQFNASDVCLDAMARGCGISAPHLSHLIAQATGYGFRVHLRGLRVVCAGYLLSTTSLSIQEVACQSGYAQVAVMDHEFDRRVHMSPGEFRCLATPLTEAF